MKKVLLNPVYTILSLGIFTILFSFSLYALLTLPGTNGFACVHRAYFSPFNVVFSIVLSLMLAFVSVGIVELSKRHKTKHQAKLLSVSGFALFIGIFTTFCTACTISIAIPVLAGFFTLFTSFNIWFKILALISLSYSLFILDGQLKGKCRACRI